MPSLKAFKDVHKGERIFLVASGTSLDLFPKGFFRDEVAIVVNWSFRVVEDATYHISKHHETAREALKHNGEIISFVSERDSSWEKNDLENDERLVVFQHPDSGKTGAINWSVGDVDLDKLMISWSTITSGMHLAAYMGAKVVVLCGYDGGTLSGQLNVEGYARGDRLWNLDAFRYRMFVPQTLAARDLLEEAYPIKYVSLSPFLGLDVEGRSFRGFYSAMNLGLLGGLRYHLEKVLLRSARMLLPFKDFLERRFSSQWRSLIAKRRSKRRM